MTKPKAAKLLFMLASSSIALGTACSHEVPSADPTVAQYRDLISRSTPFWSPPKAGHLENEWLKYALGVYDAKRRPIPIVEVPRFVALRAIQIELGVIYELKPVESQALARYPASVRSKWSPLARKLWAEASYSWKKDSPQTVRKQIAQLRKEGMNMDALEACLLGHRKYDSMDTSYLVAEEFLLYEESHPRDIVASRCAADVMYVPTFLAVDRGQPLRKDLLDRVFALEARTISNQNAFLHDRLKRLRTFSILRDTMNGKYARRK